MKAKPSYDLAALTSALAEIAGSAPTAVTLARALEEAAPILRQLKKAGWTDESVIAALTEKGAAKENEIATLLSELRRRERAAKKARDMKAKHGGKQTVNTEPAAGAQPGANSTTPKKIIATTAVTGFTKNKGVQRP